MIRNDSWLEPVATATGTPVLDLIKKCISPGEATEKQGKGKKGNSSIRFRFSVWQLKEIKRKKTSHQMFDQF